MELLEAYAKCFGRRVDYSTMNFARHEIHADSYVPDPFGGEDRGQWYLVDGSYTWVADS